MRNNQGLARSTDRDPREGHSAEIIDLATRNVLPVVSQRKPRSEALTLITGIAVVAALGGVTLWSLDSVRNAPRQATGPNVVMPPAKDGPQIEPPRGIPGNQAPNVLMPPIAGAPLPGMAPAPLAGPAANPLTAPAVVFDASNFPSLGETAMAVPGGPPGSGNGNDDFAARLGAGPGSAAAVAEPGLNPKTTVSQGTLIPAVLETAINTDVPGYVRAVVSADVRSFDGSRILVPRSSRLIGQYKSGLQAGQKRAYVIWTRLIRPDGVTVNIGSPAVSFSGETGLGGKVNTHFFERFGSAMLLSVVGGLSAIGGNAGVVIASGGQSAAAAAVGQSGQIGPTVKVRQGEPIRVFTARDLDFSKVSAE